MADSSGVRMYEMSREGDMTDVTLMVQGKEIAAHSAVAASRGGMLKDLLKENLLKEIPEKTVNIGDDLEPVTFETVLKYIYTDTVKLSDDNLFDLVFAAKKLQLKDLEKQCAEFLKTKVTRDNVGNFTEQAMQFGSEDCTTTCLEYFERNTQSVIKSVQFLDMSHGTLGKLCESCKLNCSDSELFTACVEWAKKECQRNNTGTSPEEMRTALGDVLQKIRFSRMTMEEVMKTVVPTGILTREALGDVIYSLADCPNVKVVIELKVSAFERIIEYQTITDNFNSSSSIAEVKRHISKEMDCKSDCFSLGHKGKKLSDDTSLASLYTGETLELDIHSFTVTVKSEQSAEITFEFPVMILGKNWGDDENIVKSCVHGIKNIKLDDLSVHVFRGTPDKQLVAIGDYYTQPGETVIVKVEEL